MVAGAKNETSYLGNLAPERNKTTCAGTALSFFNLAVVGLQFLELHQALSVISLKMTIVVTGVSHIPLHI